MIKQPPKIPREKKRCPISVPLSICEQTEATTEKKKVRKGSTADLSNSGLGIYTEGELQPGTVIEIECADFWTTPKNFTVKWCNRVKFNFFRIGLEIRDND